MFSAAIIAAGFFSRHPKSKTVSVYYTKQTQRWMLSALNKPVEDIGG
jgi:hypothetical protein